MQFQSYPLVLVAALCAVSAWAQTPRPKSFALPRAADGHPDLQGVWTYANDIDKPNAPLLAAAGAGSGAEAVGGYSTLVMDTTNFHPETRFRGATENLHVVERFTRVDSDTTQPNTILYKATIDDPSTFAKPWTMEFPFTAAADPVYEYACHEGNYAMTDILGGARKLEKETGAK